ncbi:hypothetical protein CRG98_037197 [Punica granatum]|uniref:Uncharacterized protein n=1 Tax=Punica granatum TaxID=22663 RepID=A0A2I0IEG3_PUNGR|nr:hypothetical protein CRG98_037197 [Punica granatum]
MLVKHSSWQGVGLQGNHRWLANPRDEVDDELRWCRRPYPSGWELLLRPPPSRLRDSNVGERSLNVGGGASSSDPNPWDEGVADIISRMGADSMDPIIESCRRKFLKEFSMELMLRKI